MPQLNEATVEVYIGTAEFNGVKPSWGATASIKCTMKGFRNNIRASKRDNGGACGDTRNRYGKRSGTFSIQTLIPQAGYQFHDVLTGTLVKHPIKIVTKTLSSLASPQTWEGVIEEWEWGGGDEEPQSENITIDLFPDW